jgi:hypothetical protein
MLTEYSVLASELIVYCFYLKKAALEATDPKLVHY